MRQERKQGVGAVFCRRIGAALLIGSMLMGPRAIAWGEETGETLVTERMSEEGMSEGEVQLQELSLEEINQELYAGTWFPIREAGVEIYLPSDWSLAEISDEDKEKGVLYSFQNDPSAPTGALAVTWVSADQMNGVTDAKALYEELSLPDSGYVNPELGRINGIDVACAELTKERSAVVTFFDVAGNAFTLTFRPDDDPDFLPYIANILCSLSLSGEEAVTEAQTG